MIVICSYALDSLISSIEIDIQSLDVFPMHIIQIIICKKPKPKIPIVILIGPQDDQMPFLHSLLPYHQAQDGINYTKESVGLIAYPVVGSRLP